MKIFDLSVIEMSQAIEKKMLNPIEIMEALLDRSNKLENRLNVWAYLDPESAMRDAIKSHDSLKSSSRKINSLSGIPGGIKDIFHTSGVKTEAGSKIFKDFVPKKDAHSVKLIREKGGIIMGKTITTEHAFGDPPITKNPWNPKHTPGGSSSGSAVGVAAKIFPFALGSQTSGSVIRPAAYNGVIGMKPTFGLISKSGIFPVSKSLDTVGIFTRTIQDTALILTAISGHDPSDEISVIKEHPDYLKLLFEKSPPPRIGIINEFFLDECDVEIRKHHHRIIKDLNAAGATLQNISLPIAMPTLLDTHSKIMAFEAAQVHKSNFRSRPEEFSPDACKTIQTGLLLTADEYHEAKKIQLQFKNSVKSLFNQIDVLLSPPTSSAAPKDLTSTGDKRFQSPWTLAGLPTLTFPIGLSKSGMPIGTQLIATHLDEANLLQASLWCYETIGKDLQVEVNF